MNLSHHISLICRIFLSLEIKFHLSSGKGFFRTIYLQFQIPETNNCYGKVKNFVIYYFVFIVKHSYLAQIINVQLTDI